MRAKTAAFDEAGESLRRLGVPGVLPTLHDAGVSISHTVLGGSHSVAVYPPIDSLTPLDPLGVVNAIDCGSDASLYVHIAFCETRCTFCHYAVAHYAGRGRSSQTDDGEVARYLDALRRELRFWGAKLASSATAVSSVYIGGGTPLLLEQEALHDIVSVIRNEYHILPGAEVCIEGSPLTITAPGGEDKLRFLREQGFTRLSFGVQSFDDAILKYAARGYRRDVPIRASSIAGRVFENWNLDLIQGLYKGSPSETWENLKVIAEIRPPHLTWYHGRFADRPQGDWYKMDSKNGCFEDEPATLLGRMLIWQELAEIGYDQIDGNRFALGHRYIDPFKKIRTSASSNLLGVGAASYSHTGTKATREDCRGYVFRNESNIRSYVDCVLAGDIPIASGRVIDEEELLATSYATGLRNGRIEDEDLRSIRRKNPGLSSHYEGLVRQLRDIGILEPYADDDGNTGLRLSELGKLFEDETLALFFSPAVKRTLAMKSFR
ncbi:MAG TPA: radical SAM protein [Pyrinomonadaceae bacterium]|nr:radical SAM protein [Pyrinomonadaceae bacterium]